MQNCSFHWIEIVGVGVGGGVGVGVVKIPYEKGVIAVPVVPPSVTAVTTVTTVTTVTHTDRRHLLHRRRVDAQHDGGALDGGRGSHSGEGLAGAARKHDDAGPRSGGVNA